MPSDRPPVDPPPVDARRRVLALWDALSRMGVSRMTACKQHQSHEWNVINAECDLRKAITRASGTSVNAGKYAARIPSLKAVAVNARAAREEHAAECQVGE